MIIPIKCVTCGNVLADKYRPYLNMVRQRKLSKGQHVDKVVYLTQKQIDRENRNESIQKTAEGEVLDELHIHNVCCRRTMLTHVDII